MLSYRQLGHATADNAANNDKALTELEDMLRTVGRYDWNYEDKRVRCGTLMLIPYKYISTTSF
jgi:hypothetical protein